MKKLYVVFYFFLFCRYLGVSQTPMHSFLMEKWDTKTPQYINNIKNFQLNWDTKSIKIKYDLSKIGKSDYYFITCGFRPAASNIEVYNAISLLGNVNSIVKIGTDKSITWNIEQDKIVINEPISVRIYGIPYCKFSMSSKLLSSLAYPGLGYYNKLNNGHWLYGFTAYSLLGTSFLFNMQANSSYEAYKNASSADAMAAVYNKTILNQKIALSAITAASFLWVFDIVTQRIY